MIKDSLCIFKALIIFMVDIVADKRWWMDRRKEWTNEARRTLTLSAAVVAGACYLLHLAPVVHNNCQLTHSNIMHGHHFMAFLLVMAPADWDINKKKFNCFIVKSCSILY